MFSYVIYIIVIRPFSTLFHELGHAIPALIFSKGKVHISIGTGYRSWKFNSNRVSFSIGLDAIWEGGYVTHEQIGRLRAVIILLMGPFAGLAFSFFLLVLWDKFLPDTHFFLPIVIFGLLELLSSIIPFSKKISIGNGNYAYNDGHQIYLLIFKQNGNDLKKVVELGSNGQFKEAEELLLQVSKQGGIDYEVLLISAFIDVQKGDLETALVKINSSLAKYPKDFKTLKFKAAILKDLNKNEEANEIRNFLITKGYK